MLSRGSCSLLHQRLQGHPQIQMTTDSQNLQNEDPRGRISSARYSGSEYILLTDEGEPETFNEAVSHKDKDKWLHAMQDEMESLLKNNTYEIVKLPHGMKALKNKWVFKLKKDGSGKVVKHKARLVVKGFLQKKGIDFDEIFSPMVKMASIRVILGLVASLNLELEQMDVKTAFFMVI